MTSLAVLQQASCCEDENNELVTWLGLGRRTTKDQLRFLALERVVELLKTEFVIYLSCESSQITKSITHLKQSKTHVCNNIWQITKRKNERKYMISKDDLITRSKLYENYLFAFAERQLN